MKTQDANGKMVKMSIRKDADGTWSRNVWSGVGCVTNVRRYSGYVSRRAARAGDISESADETNRRF